MPRQTDPADYYLRPLAGETDKAFHAFVHFRDLPPYERSLANAYREHHAECEPERSENIPSHWHNWRRDWNWISRVEAHDAAVAMERRERRLAELREAEDEIQKTARAGRLRVAERLASVGGVDENGDPIGEIIPLALLPKWFEIFSEMELKALGFADRIEHLGLPALRPPEISQLSTDDLRNIRNALRELKQKNQQGDR